MSRQASDEFYIGHAERAPRGLALRTRRVALALVVLAGALAVFLGARQGPFAPSRFEFGNTRELVGWLRTEPAPLLLVAAPHGEHEEEHAAGDGTHEEGQAAGDGTHAGEVCGAHLSAYPLVARGKHGARDAVAGLEGAHVRLRGTLIHREGRTLVELVPGSIEPVGAGAGAAPTLREERLGTFTLAGEIVDSKCFFGVMNPGEGKVHRACAARCISGGIPPFLRVRDAQGGSVNLLLVGPDGRSLNREVLDMVAEPVEVTGEVIRYDHLLVLRADPEKLRRL
jgi:hypothetical protein